MTRYYNGLDKLIITLDQGLSVLLNPSQATIPSPDTLIIDSSPLSDKTKAESARLMRVNHAGEICAQALYQGQALATDSPDLAETLNTACQEEINHLAWCRKRIHELGYNTTRLAPIWYIGSLCIGILAGKSGDAISLGFLAETERQVTKHLEKHLKKLPKADKKSYAIILQMREDEIAHTNLAESHGAASLPAWVCKGMNTVSKVMTTLSYWI